MRIALAAALAAALALPGCSLSGDGDSDRPDRPDRPGEAGEPTRPRAGEPPEAAAIRDWSASVNAGEYERAAAFFASDAVVEQNEEIRLPDRDAAIAFNRSLPCRAEVTDVEDEGRTFLAAFRLRDGPGGLCEGSARVRFRFRDGKFAEWRQLAEPAAPEGDIAQAASL